MATGGYEFWASGQGLEYTLHPGDFPEGDQFRHFYTDRLFGQDVVDFGCGLGRMAELFSKRHYIGVDICPRAIAGAKAKMHGYEFHEIALGEKLEWGFTLFAHHVMVHIPDDHLPGVIASFTHKRVIITEHTGTKPGSAIREIEVYNRAFTAGGYRMHRVQFHKWGKVPEHTVMEFHRETSN
jgi:SAM-dependent methyltransferase